MPTMSGNEHHRRLLCRLLRNDISYSIKNGEKSARPRGWKTL